MTKLYKAIRGKKTRLVGKGKDLKEAVKNALHFGELEWERFEGLLTYDQIVDYILGATQDYVIEREEK